ncbi:hypothetical protein GJ744_011787 [Endocarpon pusillum]|uniref:Uncharacterized protein n=1 Tax=Endocarpon pusillum TaxID=364733 RepID=A0A8H7AC67_9EURO|nr:hypothetical protein GJ744_011787 [Endocarpon pusillum]
MELGIVDFESFLLGRGHTGWLTGEAVMAALRVDAALVNAEVVNPNVWQVWAQSDFDQDMVPRLDTEARFIVIPYPFPGHWALGIIDRANHQMHFLDSREDQGRRCAV